MKQKNTNNDYIAIPVMGEKSCWYYNIEGLSISELIALKKALSHTNSGSYIDKVLDMTTMSSSFSAKCYEERKRRQKARTRRSPKKVLHKKTYY